MSRSMRGPKTFWPLALVLCLFGLAAPFAHAEEGASWKVEGKDAGSLAPAISIKELESHDATLTTKISGTKVEVLCTGAQPVGIKLEANGSLTSGLKVNFSGCLTKLGGTTSGPCEPNNGGKEPGAIASKALKGLLIKTEGKGLVRLEPTTGETLATIETSSTCSVGKEIPLIGKLTLKDSSLETEAETHLVVEGALTELWAVSKTEEHKATISGSMILQLAGVHAGLKWGGTIPKPPAGTWKLKGSAVTKELSPEVAVKEIESRKATLSTKISGTKVEVICEEAQPIGVKLEPEGVVTVGSQVKLLSCITKLNEKTIGACEPNNGGKEPGVIVSKALKGQLIENEKAGLIVLEPKEGETLATVETSAECSIGKEIPVVGKLTLKDSSLETEAETHLVVEGTLTELWAVSKTEEHKATISGSMVMQLAGVHAGSKWSGTVPGGGESGEKKPGKWMDEETNIEGTTTKSLEASLENKNGVLLSTIGVGLKLELECSTVELINFLLEKESKVSQGTTKGKLRFTGCIAKNGGVATGCEVHSPGKAVGTIETNTLHALEEVVGGEPTTKVLPSTGTTFVIPEMGEECAFGEELSITGSLLLKDCEAKAEVSQVTHLVVENDPEHPMLSVLGHPATIDGSVLVKLTSGHPWRWLLQ